MSFNEPDYMILVGPLTIHLSLIISFLLLQLLASLLPQHIIIYMTYNHLTKANSYAVSNFNPPLSP